MKTVEQTIANLKEIATNNNITFRATTMLNGGMSYRIVELFINPSLKIFASCNGISGPKFRPNDSTLRAIIDNAYSELQSLAKTDFFSKPLNTEYNALTDVFE